MSVISTSFAAEVGVRPETLIPLTLEEHRELGHEIKIAHARLRELCDLVISVYGPNNGAAFSFLKVTEGLERLRGDLQAQAAEDLPECPTDDIYT
jgi:hypothetical protein